MFLRLSHQPSYSGHKPEWPRNEEKKGFVKHVLHAIS
jgi:hypothetical protein